jgi:hexosaminidase
MYRRLDAVSLELEELGLTHEKNIDMMLRRLARTKEIGPLKTLWSVVEPVKQYHRAQAHPATMLSPLTRLIDAATPDSRAAREFSALVDGLLSDGPRFRENKDSIKAVLTQWRDVRPALDVLIDQSPILREAEQLPKDLSEIGNAGLEAMSYLAEDIAPPVEWRAARLAMLEQASKPKAEVEFVIIRPIRNLIILAAEMPALKNVPVSQWKQRVLTLAEEKKQ